MANYKFPVIGFTHGGSYMDADWRSEMGVNALDVGTHHIKDSYVVDWVVNTKHLYIYAMMPLLDMQQQRDGIKDGLIAKQSHIYVG